MSIGIIIVYLFLPFLFFTITYNSFKTNIFYSMLNIIFLLAVVLTSAEIKKNEYKFILIGTLISNTIYLGYSIVKNFNQINLQSIQLVFNGNRKGRAYFDFSHPNFAAMFILVEIILIYIVFFKIYKNKKIGTFFIGFFIIPLLCTGSRTAFYSLILFVGLEIYVNIMEYVDKKIRIIVIILGSGILLFIFSKLTFFLLENSSGRNIALIDNIKLLIENGKLLTGFGPVQISRLKRVIIGLKVSDNWYMTQLIRYGLFGLIIMIICVIYFIKKSNSLFEKKDKYSINLMIVLLFYSFAENVLFVPGVIVSWISWMIYFCQIELNKNNYRGIKI